MQFWLRFRSINRLFPTFTLGKRPSLGIQRQYFAPFPPPFLLHLLHLKAPFNKAVFHVFSSSVQICPLGPIPAAIRIRDLISDPSIIDDLRATYVNLREYLPSSTCHYVTTLMLTRTPCRLVRGLTLYSGIYLHSRMRNANQSKTRSVKKRKTSRAIR